MIYFPMPVLRCARCQEFLSVTLFARDRSARRGFVGSCKECRKKRTGKAKFAMSSKTIARTYPPGSCRVCEKSYPPTDEFFWTTPSGNLRRVCKTCFITRQVEREKGRREHHRERAKRYREEQPQKSRARQKRWRDRHPERRRESALKYARKNPKKLREQSRKRRTIAHNLRFDWTPEDWRSCLRHWKGCCAICGRPPGLWHDIARDHWIPITDLRPGNPGTVPWNILPLCQGRDGCNNSKNSRDPIEWLYKRLGPRKAKAKLREIEAYFESVRR